MKLSQFKIIRNAKEIKEDDYMVVISICNFSPEQFNTHKKHNLIKYKGKSYYVFLIKGMFKNFKNTSNVIVGEKIKRFNGMGVILGGMVIPGTMEFIAYKDWQSLIDDNLVLTNPFKISFEWDDDAIAFAIETNSIFYSPSNN